MDANFQIDVNPRIKRLREVIEINNKDLKVIGDRIDTRFVKNEKLLFLTGGASGGSKWAPLSPAYRRSEEARHPAKQIMVQYGKLWKSLTRRRDPGHNYHSGLKPRPFVEVGTKDIKAAWHGPGEFHNPKLPVRDVLQKTDTQEKGYYDIVRHYFLSVKTPRMMRVLRAWRAPKRKQA